MSHILDALAWTVIVVGLLFIVVSMLGSFVIVAITLWEKMGTWAGSGQVAIAALAVWATALGLEWALKRLFL